MKKWLCIGLLFIVLLAISACKKEKDKEPPFVSFISPLENQSFTVGDAIPVKFTIKDDKQISYAQIGLTDANGTSLVSTTTYNDLESGQTVGLDLLIDNPTLTAGNYFVSVRTSDGSNEKNYFRSLVVQQKPLVRRSIYLVGKSSAQFKVYALDSVFNLQLQKNLIGDFIGASVNSAAQQFISCGSSTGKLQSSNLLDWSTLWFEDPVGSTYPCFRGFNSNRDYFFVGYNAGFIKAYAVGGAVICNAAVEAGVYYPLQLGVSSNFMLSEQAAFLSGARKLVLYNFPSGNDIQEMPFTGNVVSIFPALANDFFVFYNVLGQGKISLYSKVSNGLTYTFPSSLSGKILSVTAVSETVFLLGTENGIYKFNYSPQNYTLFKAGIKASQLVYDPVTSQVLAAEGKQFYAYDINSGLLVQSKAAADTIVDIDPYYNR